MRRLLLLRHAKAEPAGLGPDFDRALADRGRKNARAIGAYIAKEGLTPDYSAVSPARRTVETWEIAAEEFAEPRDAVFDPRLYGASPVTLLSVIHSVPAKCRSAMLIGHNPGLERLALILSGSGGKRALHEMEEKFPTAALAVIHFDLDDWKDVIPEEGKLKRFVTPADLEK